MKKTNIYLIIWSVLLLRVSWLIHNGALSFFSSCHIQRNGQEFILDAACLLQGKLPKLTLQESVDTMRNDIKGFQNMYHPFSQSFIYSGTKPIFTSSYPAIIPSTDKEIRDMRQAAQAGQKISISLKQLAHYYLSSYTFYVADKDISQLKPCTKTNYELALTSVDKLLLKPGQVFNYNNHLKNLKGYCDGISGDVRLFYGGVCGVSSQLFRASLIDPDIAILQRQPHNEWFTVYYGEKVQGDDASVVEMRKQFEIKNNGSTDLYFRTKKQGTTTFLVIISPQAPTQQVKISKKYISDLQVELTRLIFQNVWATSSYGMTDADLTGSNREKVIKKETFSSRYIGKNNESR